MNAALRPILLRPDLLRNIAQDSFEDFSVLNVIFAHGFLVAGLGLSIVENDYHMWLNRDCTIVSP